jgi:hypothetical protein
MGEFNGPVEAQLFAMLTCFFTAGACTHPTLSWFSLFCFFSFPLLTRLLFFFLLIV